jgi:hypothetical protein
MMEACNLNDVCFNITQYAALRQEIFQSHVQWGSICMVIGFALASVFWYWKVRDGAKQE